MLHVHHEARTKGQIRQRLRRFVNIGLILGWSEHPNGWVVLTADREEHLLTRETAWPFLSGLAADRAGGPR